jgi:hypothetical protein
MGDRNQDLLMAETAKILDMQSFRKARTKSEPQQAGQTQMKPFPMMWIPVWAVFPVILTPWYQT